MMHGPLDQGANSAANPAKSATPLKTRSPQVNITRREFAIGTGTLALTGAAVLAGFTTLGWPQPALAQDPSPAELMKAGPLGEMILGDEKAPVTIIEYASMTCPHCAHFHETVYPDLKKRYIDTGKVRFIFREFPLDQLAAAGFMVARCSSQDVKSALPGLEVAKVSAQRYYAMIETLFAQQKTWVVQRPLQPLLNIGKQAGLTETTFNECLKNQQVLDGIEDVRTRGAQKLGVNSTPTFFINGKKFSGGMTIEDIEKQIEPYLKG
jgi:protein-disulfide isomerase